MADYYDIPKEDEDLLAQCVVNTFRSTGHGGQSVNTTDSAVRLRHLPSGIVVVARRERSQFLNKRIALEQLREKLADENKRIAKGEAPRKPQHRTHLTREEILSQKRERAELKRTRARVEPDEE
jgi:protein subunit release factor A